MITAANANNFNGYFLSQMNSAYSIYSRQSIVQSYSDYWYVNLLAFRDFPQSHCRTSLTSPTAMIQATIFTSLSSSTTHPLASFTEIRQCPSISLALARLQKLIPVASPKSAYMMRYQDCRMSIPTGTLFLQWMRSCSLSLLLSNLPTRFPAVSFRMS